MINKSKYTIYMKNGKKWQTIADGWHRSGDDWMVFEIDGVEVLRVNMGEVSVMKREVIR